MLNSFLFVFLRLLLCLFWRLILNGLFVCLFVCLHTNSTGIRTALAPRAEEQPPKKFSSLKPTKLNKNVYRYLTESKFIREGASRIIHLPTKFLSNAQPRRAVLLKNPFSEPSPKDLFITERNNVHRRLAPEYSGDNLPNSQPIAGIKGITIKTKTGKKFPGNNNNSGVRKLASPAMIAKYGLKHKQLI